MTLLKQDLRVFRAMRQHSTGGRGLWDNRERGMVTAELAVATLAALALLSTLCAGVALLVLQMRCIDTAGEVARQAARGDRAAVARARAEAPRGAEISIEVDDRVATVTVSLRARPMGDLVPAVPLRAKAEVVAEP